MVDNGTSDRSLDRRRGGAAVAGAEAVGAVVGAEVAGVVGTAAGVLLEETGGVVVGACWYFLTTFLEI
uniref:Uncharacterized protein n=1 Tax=Oryza sativa subsp. japonica TaxID=39947 RepID=Q6ZFG7_ORYSJ|nr:hypothetical protein [Oryza sativa Japonica Group]